jgi:hypothetical protein
MTTLEYYRNFNLNIYKITIKQAKLRENVNTFALTTLHSLTLL